MNDVITTIKNRRSVRNFKEEQIKDSEIETILEVGAYAPSSANQQSWHFTVVQNQEFLDKMSVAIKSIYREMPIPFLQNLGSNEKFHLYFHAPTVIVVSGNKSSMSPSIDCAMATENIMLAAESIGIGTCWVSGLPQLYDLETGNEIIKELNIPDGYKPECAIALGYKTGPNQKAAARKDNIVNYVR